MEKPLDDRAIENVGVPSAVKWSQAAAVAAALVLAGPSPSRAADIGSILGGVVGGMFGQAMQQQARPQYYQPQPQYYQPQPQYSQQPRYYQQPQHYQTQQSSAAARRRQAELARQKEQQEKEKKAQEEARVQLPAAAGNASGPIDVPMTRKNGNLWVPAQINQVVTINFVIDSGASDITLPRDVYLTYLFGHPHQG